MSDSIKVSNVSQEICLLLNPKYLVIHMLSHHISLDHVLTCCPSLVTPSTYCVTMVMSEQPMWYSKSRKSLFRSQSFKLYLNFE